MKQKQNKYGVFYYDRGRWNGPAYGEIYTKGEIERGGEKILKSYREDLQKKVRFAKSSVNWKLI